MSALEDDQQMIRQRTTREHVTKVLARRLTSEWRRHKTPNGFAAALERANSQPEDHTERILLKAGFQAWVAYFLVNRDRNRHYAGRIDECSAIEAFNLLSRREREQVATDIANVKPCSSIAVAVEGLQNHCGTKRRRLEDDDDIEASSQQASMDSPLGPENTGSAINRQPEGHVNSYSNTAVNCAATHSARNHQPEIGPISDTIHNHDYTNVTTSSFEQPPVSNPHVRYLAHIFPPYMCRAIKRDGDKAAITINIPYFDFTTPTPILECTMSLGIRPEKIEHITMQLFGIQVEIENGVRFILYPNGASIVPSPSTLQGAQIEAVDTLLGLDISRGIAESPMRIKEKEILPLATNCVTMEVSGNPDDRAILRLNLALDVGFQIKERLFI